MFRNDALTLCFANHPEEVSPILVNVIGIQQGGIFGRQDQFLQTIFVSASSGLCAVKFCTGQAQGQRSNPWRLPFVTALCIPLGLLPLVKGNIVFAAQ